MRLSVLLLFATACFEMEPIDPIGGCDLAPLPGECVDSTNPFKFTEGHPTALARGGSARVHYLALDELAFDIQSSNPAIVSIVRDGERFTMIAHADGEAFVQAVNLDTGAFLAAAAVDVEAVKSVDIAFDPAGDGPLSRLAALPGATERLRVHARGVSGRELAGAETSVTFAYEGSIRAAAIDAAEVRMGRFDLFAAPKRTGFETAIAVDTPLGAARLVARLDGVEIGALPIEVVSAPDTADLILGHDVTVTSWLEVASLVGTANGAPLAGLVADFALSPAGLVEPKKLRGGELVMYTGETPGFVTITATLPDRVLTTELDIQPRR